MFPAYTFLYIVVLKTKFVIYLGNNSMYSFTKIMLRTLDFCKCIHKDISLSKVALQNYCRKCWLIEAVYGNLHTAYAVRTQVGISFPVYTEWAKILPTEGHLTWTSRDELICSNRFNWERCECSRFIFSDENNTQNKLNWNPTAHFKSLSIYIFRVHISLFITLYPPSM